MYTQTNNLFSTWEQKTIKDITEYIVDNRGKNPPRYVEEGIPVIDNFQITGKRWVNLDESKRFVDEEVFEKFIRKHIKKNDVLVTLVGNGYGNVALAPEQISVIIQNTIGLRCKRNCLNEYLFYFLFHNKRLIKDLDRGAAQPSVKVSDLLNITLSIPQVEYQQKLVSILRNYDLLIEINERRINLLEKMAQLLYREWFVEFRFPGHKKVKFVDSELGKIPEGWIINKVVDVAKIFRGISYRSENLVDKGISFFTINCIYRNGGFKFDGIKYFEGNYKDTQLIKSNEIIIGVTDMTQARLIVGAVARIPSMGLNDGLISMDLVRVKAKSGYSKDYIYSMLRYSDFTRTVREFANGANVLHLSPKHIENYKFVLPKEKVRDQFVKMMSPIYRLMDNLVQTNLLLVNKRNLLLPKLMSGEIDVSKLDINITEN